MGLYTLYRNEGEEQVTTAVLWSEPSPSARLGHDPTQIHPGLVYSIEEMVSHNRSICVTPSYKHMHLLLVPLSGQVSHNAQVSIWGSKVIQCALYNIMYVRGKAWEQS